MSKYEDAQQTDELRSALIRAQRELARQKDRTDMLVKATISSCRDATLAMGPIPKVPKPLRSPKTGRAEVALWHMTDFQGGKRTTSYDSEVMRERALRFCEKAAELTDRQSVPVHRAVIAFGGDMVEGLFNFPSQVFEIDSTLFVQYVQVARLLVDIVRRALAIYQRVEVVAEWGNHGRIGSKRDAVPRSDNFDRMCYELARQLLADEPRVTWNDCPEDIQRIEIGNYRALLIHGDEIGRNGFASPMTIVQHANRWKSGAYPWQFRDLLVGHYHTHAEWPLADGLGAVFQTGSLESDNRYARETMASSATPSQRLHFIDPQKGRVTTQYKVWLDS